jgi:hydroxyacylglutathione hydrolase
VLLGEMDRLGLKLEQIWLTHAHIDHAGGTAELAAS